MENEAKSAAKKEFKLSHKGAAPKFISKSIWFGAFYNHFHSNIEEFKRSLSQLKECTEETTVFTGASETLAIWTVDPSLGCVWCLDLFWDISSPKGRYVLMNDHLYQNLQRENLSVRTLWSSLPLFLNVRNKDCSRGKKLEEKNSLLNWTLKSGFASSSHFFRGHASLVPR